MKKSVYKKALAFVLTLALAVSIIPPVSAQATGLTDKEIQKKIETYYSVVSKAVGGGTVYWNAGNKYDTLRKNANAGDYAKDVTGKHCKGYVKAEGCSSNVFSAHRQCMGFVLYMGYVIFQSHPTGLSAPSAVSSGYDANGWHLYKKGTFPGLQPGDIIRTGNHAVVVHSVSSNGTIKIIDCNHTANKTNEEGRCSVKFKNWSVSLQSVENNYKNGKYYILRYEGNPDAAATVTTKPLAKDDDKSVTDKTLRGSVYTTKGNVTEVGMYLGTSVNNMKKLGQDNGAICAPTKSKPKNMWYNTEKYGADLKPGTTYYYQAYAIVAGKEFRGSIEQFPTGGKATDSSIVVENKAITISLNKSNLTLDSGEIAVLVATTSPKDATVTWKTSDSNVAPVFDGIVTGGPSAGTATVTATVSYGGKTAEATCKVTVKASVCDHNYNGTDICTKCGAAFVEERYSFEKTMYAAEEEVVVRKKPYQKTGDIVKTLKKGDAVTIKYYTYNSLDHKWYITSDGLYIYDERLTEKAPAAKTTTTTTTTIIIEDPKTDPVSATVTTNKSPLNVRASAKSDAKILFTIPKGATCRVNLSKSTSEWYYVEYKGKTGYASAKWITLD